MKYYFISYHRFKLGPDLKFSSLVYASDKPLNFITLESQIRNTIDAIQVQLISFNEIDEETYNANPNLQILK